MTLPEILAAAGQALLLAALCFVAVCLLTSFLRFQALARRAAGETGASGPDALLVRLAQELGTAHRDPGPRVVLLARPGPESRGAMPAGEAPVLAARIADRLVKAVRREDAVFPYHDDTVALLLPMRRSAADQLVRRLQAETKGEGWSLRFGAAAYPEDGERAADLRRQAEAALAAAETVALGPAWAPGATPPAPLSGAAHAGTTGPDAKGLLDELTGVLLESRMETALQKYVAQCRREDRPVAMIAVDIDGLRRYNEQYGQAAGDRLLRHVADHLQACTREEDIIARHGGDQFVVALSATAGQALAIAQRVLTGLRRRPVEGGGLSLRMTASLGVAAFPEHGLVAKDLFQAAQLALQAAKAKGRNQALLFQDTLRKPQQVGADSDTF